MPLAPTGESAPNKRQQLSKPLIDAIRDLVDQGMDPETIAERVLGLARTFQEGVETSRQSWVQDRLRRDQLERDQMESGLTTRQKRCRK